MVFILKGENRCLILGPNLTYTVGRSRRNHIRLMDPKTDVFHAKIDVAEKNATIHNLQSNIYVNRKKIAKPTLVNPGDKISFGQECLYKFLQIPMQAVFDKQISEDVKEKTIEQLDLLRMTWAERIGPESCIYVINLITIDVLREMNVFWAVLAKNHVVTPNYVKDIYKNIQVAGNLPNFYRYGPEIDPELKKKGITSIFYAAERRTLFKNLVFILFEKNDDLQDLIRCCGAKCVVFCGNTDFVSKKSTYIAVNSNNDKAKPPEKMTSFFNEIHKKHVKGYTICEDDVYISIVLLDVKGVSPAHKSGSLEPQKKIRNFGELAEAYGHSSNNWIDKGVYNGNAREGTRVSVVKPSIKPAKTTEEDFEQRSDREIRDEGFKNTLKTSEHRLQSVEQESGDNRSESSHEVFTTRCRKKLRGNVDCFQSSGEDSEVFDKGERKQKQTRSESTTEDVSDRIRASNKELLDLIAIADKEMEMIDSQKSAKKMRPEEGNGQSEGREINFVINPLAAAAKKIKSTVSSETVQKEKIEKPNEPSTSGSINDKQLKEWEKKFNFKFSRID